MNGDIDAPEVSAEDRLAEQKLTGLCAFLIQEAQRLTAHINKERRGDALIEDVLRSHIRYCAANERFQAVCKEYVHQRLGV
jgi:hypothetical protein